MKIFIVTPSFPPYDGSHTQRMIALSNSLCQSGANVFVLTTEIIENAPGYNPKSLDYLDERINILRCPFGNLHRRIYLKHKNITDLKYGTSSTPSKNNSFKRKLVMFLDKLKNIFAYPDSLFDWKKPVFKYIKQSKILNVLKPDFIISCSMPNTVHVISRKLSKKYKIPMVMDYADPWVYISYYSHSKLRFLFERRLEKKCIEQGSLFSFSTVGAEELYRAKFGLKPSQTFTVVTGYDDSLKKGDGTILGDASDRPITFTYGGALQPNIRFPQPFFEAVSEIDSSVIRVLIRTDDVEYIKSLVSSNSDNSIIVEPYIPFSQYYEEMLKHDVLLFWGNVTSDQLPGKIFNYLPTRKIIFYIANNSDKNSDQTIPILEDYSNYIYVNNDKESIKKAIKNLVEKLKFSNWNSVPNDEKIEKYSTSKQFSQFYKKLIEFKKGQ